MDHWPHRRNDEFCAQFPSFSDIGRIVGEKSKNIFLFEFKYFKDLSLQVAEIGIVYNPVLGQKYTARRGKGAFYNGKQIYVSGQKNLNSALLNTEFGTSRDEEKSRITLENITKLVRVAHGFRSLGSAALNMCAVAHGGCDAYYEFGVHAWGETNKSSKHLKVSYFFQIMLLERW